MPLHDFYCGRCHAVRIDLYAPVTRAHDDPVFCPDCGQPMVWIPAAPAVHYGSVKTAAFHAFDTTDGRGNPVHIDSLRKLRRIEREAEQAYRNGEGQPMVFRRYAQDPSNRDQHTLHPSYAGGEQPTRAAAHRFGQTLRKSIEAPEAEFGPAVNETNASALPLSGKE